MEPTTVMIRQSPCSCCDEEHQYWYDLQPDGTVRLRYEGCGGRVRHDGTTRHDETGTIVPREQARQKLLDRTQDLHQTIERAQDDIAVITAMLEELR